jgi:glutaredoxin
MKQIVLFTMQGCGHCQHFKGMLNENKIEFHDRDIHQHPEEYEMFKNAKNDFVPSFMIIDDENTENSELFAAEMDYKTLDEALNIIKQKI